MRRWFAIFLLVLLPAQFAWSAAAQYCAHEVGATGDAAAVRHFGHHAHQHVAADAAHAGHADNDGTPLKGQLHADCGQCHVACGMAPVSVGECPRPQAMASPVPWQRDALVPAAWPDRPDRPRWTGLA